MNTSYAKHTPKLVVASALSAVLLIGVYIFLTTPMDETPVKASTAPQSQTTTADPITNVASTQPESTSQAVVEQTVAPSTTTPTVATPTPVPTSTYKDGTYTKTVSYSVPKGGSNSLTLTTTISGDIVTSVLTDNTYSDRESSSYVSRFESSVSAAVEGKSIDSSFGSRIGGASLTTSAFVKAISQIKQDAL